ncbi:MAG: 30S ribosomal protein S6 [Elusimicrobia bacterium]|nr:30S ribosomal protein S6 [Elusimicrobiota bacterium]
MQIYETVLILKPVMSDPEVAEFLEKTKQTVASEGGELVNHEVWGRRKLTHFIGKAREGVYVYLKYKAAPSLLKKLGHGFSVSDSVLRDMTVVARERKMREKKAKKPKPAAAAAATSASAQS